MEWNVAKSKEDTQRFHLNKILAEIRAAIDSLIAGGSSVWGSITGTLSDQTDLQAALDLKANASALAGYQPLDSDLTAIAALADPNADRILFWDDSAGAYAHLTPGTNLTITGTTIDATGGSGSGDVVGPASAVNEHVAIFDGTTGKIIKDSGLFLSGTNTGDQNLSAYALTTYVDGKVIDLILDGAVDYAPSSNAVYDALVAKQDAIQFKDNGSNEGAYGGVTSLNFSGAGVTVTGGSTSLTVNIPGGGTASSTIPVDEGDGSAGVATEYSRGDHEHPWSGTNANQIHPIEKRSLKIDYMKLVNDHAALLALATTMGVTTERTAYEASYDALVAYLAGQVTPNDWDDKVGPTQLN